MPHFSLHSPGPISQVHHRRATPTEGHYEEVRIISKAADLSPVRSGVLDRGYTYFLERRLGELRRINLPRTLVNKAGERSVHSVPSSGQPMASLTTTRPQRPDK